MLFLDTQPIKLQKKHYSKLEYMLNIFVNFEFWLSKIIGAVSSVPRMMMVRAAFTVG